MEYYSAIKRNKMGSFVKTWTDLETVTQSEVKKRKKNSKKSKTVQLTEWSFCLLVSSSHQTRN